VVHVWWDGRWGSWGRGWCWVEWCEFTQPDACYDRWHYATWPLLATHAEREQYTSAVVTAGERRDFVLYSKSHTIAVHSIVSHQSHDCRYGDKQVCKSSLSTYMRVNHLDHIRTHFLGVNLYPGISYASIYGHIFRLLLLTPYIPNVAKEEYMRSVKEVWILMTDDRPTDRPTNRPTNDQPQGPFAHFGKFQMAITLQCMIRFTLCMYTNHTLPLDSIVTVDTYFAREGN